MKKASQAGSRKTLSECRQPRPQCHHFFKVRRCEKARDVSLHEARIRLPCSFQSFGCRLGVSFAKCHSGKAKARWQVSGARSEFNLKVFLRLVKPQSSMNAREVRKRLQKILQDVDGIIPPSLICKRVG